MTDEEFSALCEEHPDLFFEMTLEGDIIVTPPNYTLTGARKSQMTGQLGEWARREHTGIVANSCSGFVLPNGARRSPASSWFPKPEVLDCNKLSVGYWNLCPLFVIELRSEWDRLPRLREKMQEYIANGAQLGWLIDPENRSVEIYRPNREPELLIDINPIAGEEPVAGFTLNLKPVWDPFEL